QPTSREAPTSKFQSSFPSAGWSLKFRISLEVGAWDLEVLLTPIFSATVRVRDPVAAARPASNFQSRTWRFYLESDQWMNRHPPLPCVRCWVAVAFLERYDTSAWGQTSLSRHSTRRIPAPPRAIQEKGTQRRCSSRLRPGRSTRG